MAIMDLRAPFVHLPRWSRRPSGLLVPTEVNRPVIRTDLPPLPDGLALPEPSLVVIGRPVSSFDQFRVFVDEAALGLKTSTYADLVGYVSSLTCEPVMVALAKVIAEVRNLRGDTEAQLKLADRIFADGDLSRRFKRFVKSHPGDVEILTEQHLNALQRLLLIHGKYGAVESDVGGQQADFNKAVLATTCLTAMHDLAGQDPDASQGEWLAYLVQNGTYNRVNAILGEMVRPQILFADISTEPGAKDHQDFCPIDEWFQADFGFTLAEQLALGLGVLGRSNILDEDVDLDERSLIGADFLQGLANQLGRSTTGARELLVGTRDWYRDRFEDGNQSIERAAWERVPFEQKPLYALSSGLLLVVSPHAITSWVGDGFYHRALASARKRAQVERFQRFYGHLVETYVMRVLESAAPPGSSGIGPVVSGDKMYGPKRRRVKSPDVAVAVGTDLILVEVASGRFTQATLREGDIEAARDDMRKLLFKKIGQLGDRIQDLFDELWIPDGLQLSEIERIWPVVVTADVTQNELLWNEIASISPKVFEDPRVRPLNIFDLADVELWAAIAEEGSGLLGILEKRAQSEYGQLELKRFVQASAEYHGEYRPSILVRRWNELTAEVAESLGFDPPPLEITE